MTDRLDLSALRNAVTAFDAGLSAVDNTAWFDQQTPTVQDILVAGVIQHFEFVYELSVKTVKRQLQQDLASPDQITHLNYRDMLRVAAEAGLIEDVEAWFVHRNTRNRSSHTYDREVSREVYAATHAFLEDARSLLVRLEARNG
jgi:nucleotidyltransferase substrate binding protein (TIGR01987 family)